MSFEEAIKEYLDYDPLTGVVYWVWPANQIDHINRDKTDDRITNLRLASEAENSQNRKSKGNKTGVKGVQFSRNRYIASVTVRGEYHYVGCYAVLREAELAVKQKREQLHEKFTNHE